jgi:hypothetical protein
MTNEHFVCKLTELIKGLSRSEQHFYTAALLKECRERIDSIKDLEAELEYFKQLCEGYEKILEQEGRGLQIEQ